MIQGSGVARRKLFLWVSAACATDGHVEKIYIIMTSPAKILAHNFSQKKRSVCNKCDEDMSDFALRREGSSDFHRFDARIFFRQVVQTGVFLCWQVR